MSELKNARPITLAQRRTLDAVRASIAAQHGLSPTLRELARRMELSHTTVYESLLALRDKGWIEMGEGEQRSIRLVGRCSQCGRLDETDGVAAVEERELGRLADDGGRA